MKKLRLFLALMICPILAQPGEITISYLTPAAPACTSGTIGVSTINTADAHGTNVFIYSELPASTYTPGQVSYCWNHFNNISGGTGFTIGVYDSSGNILAYFNANSASSTEAWQGGALNVPVCLVAGQTYYIGMVTPDGGWNQYRKTTAAGSNIKEISMTYGATLANASFASPTLDVSGTAGNMVCNDTGISP